MKEYLIAGTNRTIKELDYDAFEKLTDVLKEVDFENVTPTVKSILSEIMKKKLALKIVQAILSPEVTEEDLKKTKATLLLEVLADFLSNEGSSLINGVIGLMSSINVKAEQMKNS